MTLQELLEYRFFEIDNFSLSVYNVISMILVILIAKLIIYLIKLFIRKAAKKRNWVDSGKEYSILQLSRYFIYVIAIIFAMRSLNIDVSILVASSAALFVGIGLGLQSTFNDIFSGLILLFENTVAVGDVVEIDSLVGVVKEINIRTSRIMTRDGISIIVPNSKLINNNVINWSHLNMNTRFHVKVGVAYGSDTEKVSELMKEVASNHPDIQKSPEPRVRFTDFGESSLRFELLFWTNKTWEVEFIKSDLRYKIDSAFQENGVKIPFPQRDLHFKSGVVEVSGSKT